MTGKPEDFLDTDFILSSVGQAENLSSFGAEKNTVRWQNKKDRLVVSWLEDFQRSAIS